MKLLKVKTLEEGITLLKEELNTLFKDRTQFVPLEESLGFTLAQDVVAGEDLPSFAKSTVDGYALVASSTTGASSGIPTILKVVESIPMGKEPKKSLKASEASKVMTGGMIPQGANAVVMVENTELLGEDLLAVYEPVRNLEHVIEVGDDCKKDSILYYKGKKITPKVIGVCAALGISQVCVYTPLKVRVVSTGDETLPIDHPLEPAKTRDINTYSLSSLCQEASLDLVEKVHIQDCRESFLEYLEKDDVDLLLFSGSSSKGDHDYLADLLETSSDHQLVFHGLAIKPGKPTILGSDKRKIIVGLPGHPVSAFIVFKAFLEQGLSAFYNHPPLYPVIATLNHNMPSSPGRTLYQPVQLQREGETLLANALFSASGNFTSLAQADGYFVIHQNQEGGKKGEKIQVFLLP